MMIEDGEYISVVGKDVTHYHAQSVNPYWSDDLGYVQQVGNHIFYTEKKMNPLSRPTKLICETLPYHVYTLNTCIKYEEGI